MHLVKEFLIKSTGFSLKYWTVKLPKRMSVLLELGGYSLKQIAQQLTTWLTLGSVDLTLRQVKENEQQVVD